MRIRLIVGHYLVDPVPHDRAEFSITELGMEIKESTERS